MFDLRDFYSEENEKVQETYGKSIIKIKEIIRETENKETETINEKIPYNRFFNATAKFLIKLCNYEAKLSNEYFSSSSYDHLVQENHDLFTDILPDNYENSYANPAYCVKIFGNNIGQLISFFYLLYRNYIDYAFSHKIYKIEENNRLFIDVYNYITKNEVVYEELKELMTRNHFNETSRTRDNNYRYRTEYNKEFRFYTDIIENENLQDLRYLFKTGNYITENEIRIAEFLFQYPEDKLKTLAKECVQAYFKGFKDQNKDISNKSTVGFFYKIGMEKLYREILKEFRKKNLETVILGVYSTDVNKQMDYDHKFDFGLFFTKEFYDLHYKCIEKGMETNKDILDEYSGIVFFEKFGEQPIIPKIKTENLKLSDDQQKLFLKFNNEVIQLSKKYMPEKETSFEIIAFPTPEIGEKFEEIFEATVEINMLDSREYEKIHQFMIDVLDKADSVHVKGKGENCTDLIVKMQELEDPEKQTNFVNAGTGVNVPVGEVFTTPKLKGTNGILHAEETYQGISKFRYDNLKLTFKDGYIVDYTCTNFDSEENNKKYIEENLLFPHKSLPMGEFAIGTNTLAYVVSKKFKIMNILPVLIMEKTGPHVAIGDTCFTYSEDLPSYNQLNNKEMVAKDNEKSAQRKTDPNEAYTSKHSDITLAFDSLDFITAINKEGARVDIIKDGRFVLEGTEKLNKPLDELI
ncbi:MAG: aminopeptidase [Candidatus Hodarchaeales archaeon]